MSPHNLPEPTILNVLLTQARIEGKIDSLLAQITQQGTDIEQLWKRTGSMGKDISQLKARMESVTTQLDSTVSNGFTVASLIVAASAVVITLVINSPF